eukprot:8428157-Pyramimonas_sp.AAC.1
MNTARRSSPNSRAISASNLNENALSDEDMSASEPQKHSRSCSDPHWAAMGLRARPQILRAAFNWAFPKASITDSRLHQQLC